jgi:beta-lactam-binding protein with PASTA domain
MISWLLKKPWWFNLLAGVGLAVGLFFFWLLSLGWLTNHGKTASVPAVVGLSISEAQKMLESKGFTVEVDDSIYSDTKPGLHVLKQLPDSAELVKEGRTVYLTITRAVPPSVEMPSLRGQSYRNAELILKSMNLVVGDTIYRKDFARNAVLDQLYRGRSIKPGAQVPMGSRIDLILGNGVGNEEMLVPDLIGMRYSEASLLIGDMGLGLGVLILSPEVTDTLSGYVVRQEPVTRLGDSVVNRIRAGQLIDIWLGATPPVKDTIRIQ